MAAITDLADLFVAVTEYAGRADFAPQFPRFVALAEDRIARALRASAQEQAITLTADVDGKATLPDDFRELRSVLSGSLPLTGISSRLAVPTSGIATGFYVSGQTLTVSPVEAATLTIIYYSMPRLTADEPTNSVLSAHPDCYLYAVLMEVATWSRDAEGVGAARAMFSAAVDEALAEDERRRFGLSQYRPSRVTP